MQHCHFVDIQVRIHNTMGDNNMDIQKTSDMTVADVLLQHIRQNATLPMSWEMSSTQGDCWVLEFTPPVGEASADFLIHADTPWQQLLYSVRWTEEEYRNQQNQNIGLTPLTRAEAV
jgi:hypothetical protein